MPPVSPGENDRLSEKEMLSLPKSTPSTMPRAMGEEVGVGQLLGVVAQQACHAFDTVFLAHHHQLVAELQRQVGRGGEVDAASADAGDGAAEVLHQVKVAQLLVYHILLGEQQGFNLLHVYEWQFAFFAFAHEDGELV